MKYSVDYEKLFFLYSLKNPKYLKHFNKKFFTNEQVDVLATMVKDFHEEFAEIPSVKQLKILIEDEKFEKQISADDIDLIFDINIKEYDDEWLKKVSEAWIMWRNFDKQLLRTIEYVKVQDVNPGNVQEIINHSIGMLNDRGNIVFNSDLGTNFFDADLHSQKSSNKISSNLNFIDGLMDGGYDIKTLVVYSGQAGLGKSIFLTNDAANFVRAGHNVCYISAEMSEAKVLKRIGANMLNITMDEYSTVSKNKELIKRKLREVGMGIMPPGQLNIKEFPTSQATILDIENYLNELEKATGQKVKVLIIDYINILNNYRNSNSENTYMKIKQIAEDLRALAVRRECLIISATQINRQGYNSTDLKMEHISESAGLAHTVDMLYGIIQDDIMRSNNEYWLKILKIRDGDGLGTRCKFEIDYTHMRLTETGEITGSD